MQGHIEWMKVAVMHGNPLGTLPTKPGGFWNRDVDKLGVGIGDSIESNAVSWESATCGSSGP